MDSVIFEFDRKVKEVEAYFRYLDHALDDDVHLFFLKNKRKKVRKFDDDIQKILKAGTFLILYNLIESTVRTAVEEIYVTIKDKDVSYRNLRDELRHLLIRDRFIQLENSDAGRAKIRNMAKEIVEDAIENVAVEFNIANLPISGNLDADKVRQLSKKIGFSGKFHSRTRGGGRLEIVKEMRNSLAHGALSFSECGRDYDKTELLEIKKEVILYLRNFIRNIKRYIDNEGYYV